MLPVSQPIQHRPGRNLISLKQAAGREATLKELNDNQLLIPSWRENRRKEEKIVLYRAVVTLMEVEFF